MEPIRFQKYLQEKKCLEMDFEKARKDLIIKYAKEDCQANIGDIVIDCDTIILVTKIFQAVDLSGEPTSVFEGPLLTKKFVPFKKGQVGTVWQRYKIKIISK